MSLFEIECLSLKFVLVLTISVDTDEIKQAQPC